MSDIELAIRRCKRLETLLEEELGASGRGLHEKVSSVEADLPNTLVKRLRFIATVRNKLVHEPDSNWLDDRRDYENACDAAERELKKLARRRDGLSACWATSTAWVVGLLVVLLLLIMTLCGGGLLMLGCGPRRSERLVVMMPLVDIQS